MPDEDVQEEVEELGLATAKRGIIYVAGDLISSILTVVLLIFLARVLQPAQFGIYSIVIAFSLLLNVGSNFGMGTAFRKMLPEAGEEKKRIHAILANGYFIALLLGLVIAFAGFLASGYLAVNVYHNPSMTILLQVASVAVFLAVLYNLTLAALTGIGAMSHAGISNITYGGIGLVVTVVLVDFGYGVLGAILGLAAAYVLAALVGLAALKMKTGFKPAKVNRSEMSKMTRFSAPVVVSHLAQFGVQNFAVLFLGIVATTTIVGNYGSAFKLARVVELAITDLTFILLPAYSMTLSKARIADKIGNIYNNSIYYSSLFLFPIVAYFVATAIPITNLFFSNSYSLAPFYVMVMMAGMALSIIGIYAGTLLIGKGDTKKFMKYQVIAVIVQLALVLGLAPYLGADGLLLALFVVAPIFLDIIYIIALREQFRFEQKFGKIGRIALAAIITWAVLYGISLAANPSSKWLILINAASAIIIFPPLAVLSGSVKRNNLEFLRKVGGRLTPVRPVLNVLISYTSIFIRGGADKNL